MGCVLVSAYGDELVKAMRMLGEVPTSIFLGQSVRYPGHIMTGTLLGVVPDEKLLELPVFEETQLGMSFGLLLEGYHPVVSVFPRMDFLLLAMNQLVNHLDKWREMSHGQFTTGGLLIRTMVGSIYPLYPGPQHCHDHTAALRLMLTDVDVVTLTEPTHIQPAYMRALHSSRATILVEAPPRREGYE